MNTAKRPPKGGLSSLVEHTGIEEAAESCEMLREMSEKFIRDNATKAMDQKAFQKKYDFSVQERYGSNEVTESSCPSPLHRDKIHATTERDRDIRYYFRLNR